MIPCSLTTFSHTLLENVLKKRIKLIFFQYEDEYICGYLLLGHTIKY